MAKKSQSTPAYVSINATRSIRVTCGLQYEDVTNKDAHVPDRLRVLEKWSKYAILLKRGQHDYPAEIVEWPTVKALAAQKIITIGGYIDEPAEESAKEMKTVVEEMKDDIKEEASPLEKAAEENPDPAKGV